MSESSPVEPEQPEQPAQPLSTTAPLPRESDLEQFSTGQLLHLNEPAPDPEVVPVNIPFGGLSLGLGLTGMIGGLFVGWLFPAAIAAVVFALLARRRLDRGWSARIGLASGIAGVLFGGVWLLYYLSLLSR